MPANKHLRKGRTRPCDDLKVPSGTAAPWRNLPPLEEDLEGLPEGLKKDAPIGTRLRAVRRDGLRRNLPSDALCPKRAEGGEGLPLPETANPLGCPRGSAKRRGRSPLPNRDLRALARSVLGHRVGARQPPSPQRPGALRRIGVIHGSYMNYPQTVFLGLLISSSKGRGSKSLLFLRY